MTSLAGPILAVDPGLAALGIAVLESDGRLRHAGVLTTPHRLGTSARLAQLRGDLVQVLGLHRPRLLVLEQTWPSRNKSLALVHRVSTLCARLARSRGIRVLMVPASTVRRHLTGSGWAGKVRVAHVVASRYRELAIYLTNDRAWKVRHFGNLFDAVALGSWALDTGRAPRPFRTPRHRHR